MIPSKKIIKEILETRFYSATGMHMLNGGWATVSKLKIKERSIPWMR